MEIRESTRRNYEAFLKAIASNTVPFSLPDAVKSYGVDVKLASFLVNQDYLVKDKNEITKVKFYEAHIDTILNGFLDYRSKLVSNSEQELKDLKYYRENKEFLVDKRKLPPAMTVEEVSEIKKSVINDYTKEIVKYVKLAIELGKTDIETFVLTLINIK